MSKRALDVLVVLLLAPLVAMVCIVIAVRVSKDVGRPVLFRQWRPGRDGKLFELVKFRTMRDSLDEDGKPLDDRERLTPFGMRLRSTSLDELPTLWHVLTGDMSLVGPRPLLPEYLPLYSDEQARRHEVRPGVTGWVQVNGRNSLTWEEKFDLDVWYVDNRSLMLDLRILFMTVKKVWSRDGITADGEVSMPRFSGSAPEVLDVEPLD